VSELRPTVKNGDLLAALNELKSWNFFAPETTWEKINLTDKGKLYTKMIKKLLSLEALHVPQSNGLFDYRTEPGRRVIFELVRFLMARFNLQEYFQYLNLPVLDPDLPDQDVKTLIESELGANFDYRSEVGRTALLNFLKKRSTRKIRRTTDSINKKFLQSSAPVAFDLRLVRKFLQEKGLKRPEPIFAHFNSVEPKIFEVHERQLSIYMLELRKIAEILEEYVETFAAEDHSWLADYFSLVNLPTEFFGFSLPGEFSFASEKADTFLSIAWDGPKFCASQLSSYNDLGYLELILFPISEQRSIVISCTGLILFYLALPGNQCTFAVKSSLASPNYHFLISQKPSQFGNLLQYNTLPKFFPQEVLSDIIVSQAEVVKEQRFSRRGKTPPEGKEKDKELEKREEVEIQRWGYSIAAFFSICQVIAEKLTSEYTIPRATCIFEHGVLSVANFPESSNLLATINIGTIEVGPEISKAIDKIRTSVGHIFDLKGEGHEAKNHDVKV
jgi:hypothetical protein